LHRPLFRRIDDPGQAGGIAFGTPLFHSGAMPFFIAPYADFMSAQIKYTDEPLGESQLIPDFLPPPAELAFREEGVKVTLPLSKKSIEFLKSEATKRHTQYQRMTRKLLDAYVDAQGAGGRNLAVRPQLAGVLRYSSASRRRGVFMPTVLRLFNWRFHFYSDEGQEPPHKLSRISLSANVIAASYVEA
jgi:hypothetical protein